MSHQLLIAWATCLGPITVALVWLAVNASDGQLFGALLTLAMASPLLFLHPSLAPTPPEQP